jgi:precorrin-3B C17-methyltransferase
MAARMMGSLRVVGLGPGKAEWITSEVQAALGKAEHLVGYHTYLARLPTYEGKVVHGSDNGDELERARHALGLCEGGAHVVVVSGGDPGVFGMAAAVFEAIEQGPVAWRGLDIAVLPGVTAMLAAAARLGAMLGHDFCALNLSNNLKPWATIERRLALAAQADFVIALYNPASRSRSEQVHRAFAILLQHRTPSAVTVFAKAIGREQEQLIVTTLGQADPALADMQTLVLVGNQATRRIERAGGSPWVYTPRRWSDAS